jgi:hypothetical protein
LALEEGRFGLDDPVVSFAPEFDAEITDPRSRSASPPRWQDWTERPFPVASGAEGASAAPLTSIKLRNAAHGLEVTVAEPANAHRRERTGRDVST